MREVCADRLGHPYRHDRPRGGELVELLGGKTGQNRFEVVFDLPGSEPSQGPDDFARLAMRGRELPARSVAQLDRDGAEAQAPVWTGSQVDLPYRILGGQTQTVRRGASAWNDGLAPQSRKRRERLSDMRRALSEAGLDGSHVDALANAEELPGAGEARQSLVHRRPFAQVQEGSRAYRRRLGKGRSVFHDAFGEGPAWFRLVKCLSEI